MKPNDNQQICTTLEQSRMLQQMGVDCETADMTWCCSLWTPRTAYGEDGYCLFARPGITTSQDPDGTPAWSVSAMMKLLPKGTAVPCSDTPRDDVFRMFLKHLSDGKART